MPLPPNDAGRGGMPISSGSTSTKGRIDFSPSLDSIDPKCPPSPVANNEGSVWDTETDHILSYFLGGDALLPVSEEPGFTSGRKPIETSREDDVDMLLLPPTPVVQFYSNDTRRSSQNYRGLKHVGKSSSGNEDGKMNDLAISQAFLGLPAEYGDNRVSKDMSLSNLDSMHSQHNPSYQEMYSRKHNSSADLPLHAMHSYSSENPSPISPAAMISVNENLLLPYPAPNIGIKLDKLKIIALSDTVMQTTDSGALSHTSNTDVISGMFDIDNHETRFLPPEKLLEVFPAPHRTFQSSHQNHAGLAAAAQGINSSFDEVTMSHINHSNSNQNAIGSSGVTGAPNPQHFIYSHHPDVAAAILNRHHAFLNSNPTPPVETEEKRAKRLERNRESARKSRRKKKERLLTSGAQVKKLQDEIEIERRKHINAMVPVMSRLRLEDIHILLHRIMSHEFANEIISDRTCIMIQESGPNSRIMRSVLDFQYTALKQLTLPNYQKILLWFSLLEENFFTAGKDEYVKRISTDSAKSSTKKPVRSSPAASAGKNVSSKQVGEELFLSSKDESTEKGKKSRDREYDSGDRPCVVSGAYDGSRTWPLLSFELRLSVDQEERFLFTHKQLRQNASRKRVVIDNKQGNSPVNHLSQISTACNTADSLSKAVGSLSHVISRREEVSLARILTTQQLSNFQKWMFDENNRTRCRNRVHSTFGLNATMQACDISSMSRVTETVSESNNVMTSKEFSLQDICWRLNNILRISNV